MTTVAPTKPAKRILTREQRIVGVYDQYRREPGFEHLRYGTRFVPGRGSTRPLVLAIADVPTHEDSCSGKALVGRQRTTLEMILRSADLKPEHVFFTYLLKYRPPKGRDPREQESETALSYLWDEWSILRPKAVLLLGRYVTRQFFDEPFTEIRGELAYDQDGVAYLPTYSLEASLHNPALREDVQRDSKTLAEAL